MNLDDIKHVVSSLLSCKVVVYSSHMVGGRARTFRCITSDGNKYIAKIVSTLQWPEANVLQFLDGANEIVVPKVVTISSFTNDTAIVVMHELPGVPLSEKLDDYDAPKLKYWGDEAGKLLKRLHRLKFNHCGVITETGVRPIKYQDCRRWLFRMIEDAFKKITDSFFISLNIGISKKTFYKEIDKAFRMLESFHYKKPCLVHGDFSPKNIILLDSINSNTEKFGLIDWEWAKSFQESFDVCRYLIETHYCEPHWRAFWATWSNNNDQLIQEVASYIIIETFLHFGWAISQQRTPQEKTTQFIRKYRTLNRISTWLENGLS